MVQLILRTAASINTSFPSGSFVPGATTTATSLFANTVSVTGGSIMGPGGTSSDLVSMTGVNYSVVPSASAVPEPGSLLETQVD